MSYSRRRAIELGLGVGAAALSAAALSPVVALAAPARAPWRPGKDGQRRADLGNGRFLNPVFAGDHADPNVLKDGQDYYVTFSSFDHYPAVVIWHSRDLVNWRPVGPALKLPIGSIYALDLVKHEGRYFIYIPAVNLPGGTRYAAAAPGSILSIFVIHADSMSGPWSEPVRVGVETRVDPGHVVGEDGKRYLFVNEGNIVPLSDDGLKAAGPQKKVYDGWRYPNEWIDEGFGLEGPKLMRRGDYFYLFSAQAGTGGPPTSHMVVVARAKSVHGPWENMPGNPLVRTRSVAEPWWSRGHATPVEGPDGRWWLSYHGYENGYRTLGRQMLLDPMEWGTDGWPRMTGGDLSRPLRKPAAIAGAEHGISLSAPFAPSDLGPRLTFFKPGLNYLDRASFASGALTLKAQGKGPADSSPLAFIAGDRAYETIVEVDLQDGARAGLLLFYDDKFFCGISSDGKRFQKYKLGREGGGFGPATPGIGTRFWLKLVNQDQVGSFYASRDGRSWDRIVSYEVAGYNHNMAGGFLSLRPAYFVSGAGHATFRNPRYRALA